MSRAWSGPEKGPLQKTPAVTPTHAFLEPTPPQQTQQLAVYPAASPQEYWEKFAIVGGPLGPDLADLADCSPLRFPAALYIPVSSPAAGHFECRGR
jgi:hypothetical protein